MALAWTCPLCGERVHNEHGVRVRFVACNTTQRNNFAAPDRSTQAHKSNLLKNPKDPSRCDCVEGSSQDIDDEFVGTPSSSDVTPSSSDVSDSAEGSPEETDEQSDTI